MTLQVAQPQKASDPFAALGTAINIGTSIYGINSDMTKLEIAKKQFETQQQLYAQEKERNQLMIADLKRQEAERSGIERGKPSVAQQISTGLTPIADKNLSETFKGKTEVELAGEGIKTLAIPIKDKQGNTIGYKQQYFKQSPTFTNVVAAGIAKTELALKMEKELQEIKRGLTTKREVFEKEMRPFERLYGGIDQFRKSFQDGTLNAQDRIALVRSMVPLTEINPGVVREAEVALVTDQQSVFDAVQSWKSGKFEGVKVPDNVIEQLFSSAEKLKPVVDKMFFTGIENIRNQAIDEGLATKLDVILGKHNIPILDDPSKFALIDKKLKVTDPMESLAMQIKAMDSNPKTQIEILNDLIQKREATVGLRR